MQYLAEYLVSSFFMNSNMTSYIYYLMLFLLPSIKTKLSLFCTIQCYSSLLIMLRFITDAFYKFSEYGISISFRSPSPS